LGHWSRRSYKKGNPYHPKRTRKKKHSARLKTKEQRKNWRIGGTILPSAAGARGEKKKAKEPRLNWGQKKERGRTASPDHGSD